MVSISITAYRSCGASSVRSTPVEANDRVVFLVPPSLFHFHALVCSNSLDLNVAFYFPASEQTMVAGIINSLSPGS